ncbi:MAG: hypothetical protein OSB09_00645 [Planctomycetota bacterium]|nr:hypothetical protein [Planctomycetota bacterium]
MLSHLRDLESLPGSEDLVDSVRSGPETLDERARIIAAFTEKLTRSPSKMDASDIDALRRVGFDDGTILELVHVIGFFNHINRVADSLGVDLEAWMGESGADRGLSPD